MATLEGRGEVIPFKAIKAHSLSRRTVLVFYTVVHNRNSCVRNFKKESETDSSLHTGHSQREVSVNVRLGVLGSYEGASQSY